MEISEPVTQQSGTMQSRSIAENPCNMCMPMGGIIALKGVEGAMVILHGSQGCSTYMRRHIAEHFDEPVDVGSSSLNEKGTIYGGSSQLKTAIDNIRKVYNPAVIGVLTTCLAETTGEDVHRIVEEYCRERGVSREMFITSSTPGYGGSHGDGYWYTLRSVVEQITRPAAPHDGVNIIVPITFSPADVRAMKQTLTAMGVSFTIFPDISETMDRPYKTTYTKMPTGGTPVAEIRKMSGAKATIEFGAPGEEKKFPGRYLEDTFGVPYHRIASPIGLAQTDNFFALLKTITGKSMTAETFAERGRLMDAMIDGHKHAFAGRSTLFGDADLVYALAGFTIEIGMYPRVIASDSRSKHWKEAVTALADGSLEPVTVLCDTDFATVRRESETAGSNIALGHSDGKYLEEHSGIPLVRLGFPIHDRIGGQRICSVLYSGTNRLLDTCVNTLLERKYRSYRKRMYDQYFPSSRR
ncbi:MAG: nitrogenase [Methanocorpusculum sp.]|nr:nitrogenase [Methanocorpusculum sp.]